MLLLRLPHRLRRRSLPLAWWLRGGWGGRHPLWRPGRGLSLLLLQPLVPPLRQPLLQRPGRALQLLWGQRHMAADSRLALSPLLSLPPPLPLCTCL